MELHFEHIILESLAVARLAGKRKVGHELHFYRNRAFALTFLASAALGIEREVAWRVSHLLGKRLVGEEFPDFVVCLEICNRIASG